MCINHAKLRAIVHCSSSQTLIHPLYLNTHIHKTCSQSRLQWLSFPWLSVLIQSSAFRWCHRSLCVCDSSFGFLLNSCSPTLELFNLSDGERGWKRASGQIEGLRSGDHDNLWNPSGWHLCRFRSLCPSQSPSLLFLWLSSNKQATSFHFITDSVKSDDLTRPSESSLISNRNDWPQQTCEVSLIQQDWL